MKQVLALICFVMFRKLRFNRSRYPTAPLSVKIDADFRCESGIAVYSPEGLSPVIKLE
jgi:hypothetical protein